MPRVFMDHFFFRQRKGVFCSKYINTWSEVGNYKKEKNENPVPALMDAIKGVTESAHFHVEFPLFLKLYRIG